MDDELRETFDARKRPLLWKVDCEGNELETFRGATRLLSTMPPPVIIFETATINTAACLGILIAHGYMVYSVSKSDSEYPPNERLNVNSFASWSLR